MDEKQFKYQSYLGNFENCPMENCIERNVQAFRWVHSDVKDYDFSPNADHPKCPTKTLDDSDLICESFALSLHKDLKSSIKNYLHQYNKRKNDLAKDRFKDQKGDTVALLQLTEKDGVSDEPNEEGHISFFPYIGFNYLESVREGFSIFA